VVREGGGETHKKRGGGGGGGGGGPGSICSPRIPHGLTGDRTQFPDLGIRRITVGALAWLQKKVELSRINNSSFLSFLVLPSFPTHCRCRASQLHLITLKNTHTHTL